MRGDDRVDQSEIVVLRIGGAEEVRANGREIERDLRLQVEQDVDRPLKVTHPVLEHRKQHDGSAVAAVGMRCDQNLHAISLTLSPTAAGSPAAPTR